MHSKRFEGTNNCFYFFKTGFLNFPFVGACIMCRINFIPNAGFPSYSNWDSFSTLHLFLKSVQWCLVKLHTDFKGLFQEVLKGYGMGRQSDALYFPGVPRWILQFWTPQYLVYSSNNSESIVYMCFVTFLILFMEPLACCN